VLTRLKVALTLDLDQVDLRRGVVGLAGIVATIVFVAIFGTVGMTAGLAVLFVVVADSPGPRRDRLVGVLVITLVGALVAAIATWAGTDHVWVATLLTVGITAIATLAAGFGHAWAMRGILLSLWAVVALSVAGEGESALELAAAYVLGGLVAAAILWLQSRMSHEPAEQATSSGPAARTLGEIARSPLGVFALLRAVAVGLATVLGIELFPEYPIWPALTVVLVLRPKVGATLEIGVLRTLGTLGGTMAAAGIVALAGGSDAAVIVAFLVAALAMMALKDVNYAVFVFFLSAVLVLIQDLLGKDADLAAEQRLLATLLGAGIAFAALWIVLRLVPQGRGAPRGSEG